MAVGNRPRTEKPKGPGLLGVIANKVFQNYVWQSIFRSGYPNTPRNQMLAVATNVFLHLHPTRIHKTHVKITHTYCLGGLSFFLFLGLTVTGVLLMFYYVPSVERAYTDIAALETNVRYGSLMRNMHRWMAHGMVLTVLLHMMRVFYTGAYKPPREFNWVVGVILLMFYYVPSVERAYLDIQTIQTNVQFGQLMRNMHRWMAHAMVILVFLHMMRVFYTGAYKPPREFNWVVGVILLVLTFLLSFTGYLLPWDQLAFWAITVGTNIAGSAPVLGPKSRFWLLGGFEVGPDSLIRFYTLHVIGLPLLAAIFMAVHFWRIRRDGGLARPL